MDTSTIKTKEAAQARIAEIDAKLKEVDKGLYAAITPKVEKDGFTEDDVHTLMNATQSIRTAAINNGLPPGSKLYGALVGLLYNGGERPAHNTVNYGNPETTTNTLHGFDAGRVIGETIWNKLEGSEFDALVAERDALEDAFPNPQSGGLADMMRMMGLNFPADPTDDPLDRPLKNEVNEDDIDDGIASAAEELGQVAAELEDDDPADGDDDGETDVVEEMTTSGEKEFKLLADATCGEGQCGGNE